MYLWLGKFDFTKFKSGFEFEVTYTMGNQQRRTCCLIKPYSDKKAPNIFVGVLSHQRPHVTLNLTNCTASGHATLDFDNNKIAL